LHVPFDLYIVDINMPKRDGYGLLRDLRGEEMPQAPAIMVKALYEADASSYLIKPIRSQKLEDELRTLKLI